MEYGEECISPSNYEGVTRFYQLYNPLILYDYVLCDNCFKKRQDLVYINKQQMVFYCDLPDYLDYSINQLSSTMVSPVDFHITCANNAPIIFDKYDYATNINTATKQYTVLTPTNYKDNPLIDDSEMMLIRKGLSEENIKKYQDILDERVIRHRNLKIGLFLVIIYFIFIYFCVH